ncbi:FHA domain-containing protein [Streptomyces rectiviolaceus]|uniref:FHA domain-containing protein n=1 Tax=Streptomyces rectiviolaceus TaxID=332591 RepID=A0ABP6M8F1_9ACTN
MNSFSIIVVPPGQQIRLAPGECLGFGRRDHAVQDHASRHPSRAVGRWFSIPHEGVSRSAGMIAASGDHWTLSNFSRRQTYVVENPEGAGEHIKVAPGRTEAAVPFEFARVVMPAAEELISFDVWAPHHNYRPEEESEDPDQDRTDPAFPLDRSKLYFLALAALCEPRLRGDPYAALPTSRQLLSRLQPVWPAVSRTTLQWNIDYLAVKLRLKPAPEAADRGSRHHGKKESLAMFALRFDLVREEDLALLRAKPGH